MSMVFTGMAKAAKKKPMGRPKVGERKEVIINFGGVQAYREWFQGLADHVGLTLTDTIAQALRRYAESESYGPPPKR